jgi:gliding motility-associated-like protein
MQGPACNAGPVTFTISVTPASAAPAIVTTGSPAALNTVYGTPSASTSFNVLGNNLTAGILVTPPAGFEVSADNTIFSNTLTIAAGAGNTPVYIRLTGTAYAGNYTGNIVLSSAGTASVNISIPQSVVNPAVLTVMADNKTRRYGSPNPVLTATYSGFVNGENVLQLTTPPQLSTIATITSQPGDYRILVNGAASNNYTFIYETGTLTITAGRQQPLVPNVFTPNNDGHNDTWDIQYLDAYPNCLVNVYDRYGQNVLTSHGYSNPWNGTRNNVALPDGAYYYMISLDNGQSVISGYVTIIR